MLRTDGRRRIAAAAMMAMAVGCGQAMAQDATQQRLSGLKLSGNQPIQIESDKLEVRENDGIAIFSGNVSVTQGPTLMKSGRLTVFYAKGGGSAATGSADIDRLEVDEKVYVRSEKQEATGDRGEFDMKTEVLVLSGDKVVLSEGPNVLVGCKLTVQMRTGLAQVDGCKSGDKGGRVMMSITPDSVQN